MLEQKETVEKLITSAGDKLNVPSWVCMFPEVRLIAATDLAPAFNLTLKILHPESYQSGSSSEKLVEFGGRNCYQSHHNPAGRTTEEYIQNIINLKHFSVLEHANATFLLEGVSRAFTHELIRHRHHSYSQLSQRYVDQEGLRFVCPPLIREVPEAFYYWKAVVAGDRTRYGKLVQILEGTTNKTRKEVREAARSVMPECTETKIVVTGNMRAWRELLEKRWSSHADAEMAEVAGRVWELLNLNYPSLFNDIKYH